MGKGENWSDKEQKVMERYFKVPISELTLFSKINKINTKRSFEGICRRLRLMKENGWERDKNIAIKKLRVGYLDLECSNLNADFGYILSWYIKKAGKNEYDSSVIKKSEIFNYSFDKRVVEELLKALNNYDVIYAHWGIDRRFDIPFLRTRAYKHNLQNLLPNYMEKFMLDTWDIAKNKLRLHSNRLDSIAEAVGIKNVKKTPLSADRWQLAQAGNPEALKYIVEHNRKDVILLNRIHDKLKKIEKPIFRSF